MIANDVTFNVLAAFEAKKIKVVPEITYRVYRRKGSLTSQPNRDAFLTRLNVSSKLATKLKEKEIPYRPSVTGALINSIKYGPKTFMKVLKIAFVSDMEFNILKLFNINKWVKFFYHSRSTKKEIDNLDR